MMTRAQKIAQNKADKAIDKVYNECCSGITIPMMQIPNIFAEGRKALAEGRDLKQAIVAFVETIRTDKVA
jgi:hypothetical protein